MTPTTEREALENLTKAWDVLPRGHYTPNEIQAWMRDHLGPAVLVAKDVLSRAHEQSTPGGKDD